MIIEISTKKTRPIPLRVGHSQELPSFEVDSRSFFSARAIIENGDEDDFFILQVGKDPDIRAAKEFGKADFLAWDKTTKEWKIKAFRLFQDTLGTSVLFLLDLHGNFIPLAEITVKNEDKEHLYDSMVASLLKQELPHFVLDDFRGQMRQNHFAISWHDGYASYESPDVMLRILARLIERMKPLLIFVNSSPVMAFARCSKQISISKLSGMSPGFVRRIESVMVRNDITSFEDASDFPIPTSTKCNSYDAPAHFAIRTFLLKIKMRLDRIEKALLERGREADEGKNIKKRNSYAVNLYAENKAIIDSLWGKLAVLDRLKSDVIYLMNLPFLAKTTKIVDIFDVEYGDFSFNEAYRQLYMIMLDYSRTSFWWVGDRSNGIWKMPRLELQANGETRQQHKYSIVYENWCYAKLIEALVSLGFVCVKGNTFLNKNGSYAIFTKDNVEVKIQHGVTAPRPTKQNKRFSADGEFFYVGNGMSDKKTPDFAVIIKKGSVSSWFVADAKSDDRLNETMALKRESYCDITWSGKKPFASILLRSGESKGFYPSIEIPPPRNNATQMQSPLFDLLKDESEEGGVHLDYLWHDEEGIKGDNGGLPFQGNLKFNVDSIKNDSSILERFIKGMIETASRLSGSY